MGRRRRFAFYIISNDTRGFKRLKIPVFYRVMCFTLLVAGVSGFIRSAYFIISYSVARYGLYHEMNKNRVLIKKIEFLQKFSHESARKSQTLIVFEDETRLRYGLDSISKDVRLAGIGGQEDFQAMVEQSFEDPVVQNAKKIEKNVASVARQIEVLKRTFHAMEREVKSHHLKWEQRPSIWPTRGRLTSSYGYRFHPIVGMTMFHDGLDIANHIWTPIVATAQGVVHYSGYRGHYGTSIIITHKEAELQTVYAHLQQASVVEGQVVYRGDLIGYMGNSGRSTGPHLHYEIRKANRTVDPKGFILPLDCIVD